MTIPWKIKLLEKLDTIELMLKEIGEYDDYLMSLLGRTEEVGYVMSQWQPVINDFKRCVGEIRYIRQLNRWVKIIVEFEEIVNHMNDEVFI